MKLGNTEELKLIPGPKTRNDIELATSDKNTRKASN